LLMLTPMSSASLAAGILMKCSDTFLQAQPVMRNFTCLMLQGGNYTLLPGQDVPDLDIPNPQQA
jgi:hypothetical protein